jgi:5-methylcytosine-specific restriction protein A
VPWSAPRPCRYYGCPYTTVNGYCEEHMVVAKQKERERKAKYEKTRINPHKWMYNSKGWKTLRTRHLKQYPLCSICALPANHVDHIIPHEGDTALFYDAGNLQSMCSSHHSAKTAREDGGFGNPKR